MEAILRIRPDFYYRPSAPELRQLAAVQTFARWRHEGKGPAYVKSGSRILYYGADLLAWLEARKIATDTVA